VRGKELKVLVADRHLPSSPSASAAAKAVRAASRSTTLLAFDFGTRHLGVAVGSTETRLAHALGVIHAESNADRMVGIDRYLREWQPTRLVVGLPLSLDGGEQEMTALARRFVRQLAARFGLPVDFADERLSSVSAEEGLRAAGRGGRKNKQRLHSEAARIILQGYLDESA
jgi:putative Holliday junction resolvase